MDTFHSNQFMFVKDITLLVSNIDQQIKFYTEVLGLKLIEKRANRYLLGTHTNQLLITLEHNILATPKEKSTGLYHFAILLPSRAHLGQFIKHLIKLQTPVTGGADHGISEALYLDDPEGNGIEIYADRLKKDWPDFNEVVNKPMDYQDLVNHAIETPFTQIPDGTIMGHIHLHVSRIEKGTQFFKNVLTFQSTMAYGPHAHFVSDGGYHHHVGFNVWNGIDIKNKSELSTGLIAYTIQLPLDKYNSLKENFKLKRVELLKDEHGEYIKDMNDVNVYFTTV